MKRKLWKLMKNLDVILAGIILGILVLVTFLGVIMRYVFNAPFIWQQEVQLSCFLWLSYLGAGAAFLSGSHVAVDIFVDSFPGRIQEILRMAAYILICIILIYFSLQCNKLLMQMAQMHKVTNILHMPYTVVYAVVPIGCILMLVDYSIVTVRYYKERGNRHE